MEICEACAGAAGKHNPPPMKKRLFGNTGVYVGEIGLGTWQLGADWGVVTEETAFATMRAAVESGTTLFDTADVYGMGRSETLIGRFLKETSVPVFVATKFGRFSPPGWPENFGRKAVRSHAEASLRRLGVEALDLTQLHCLPPEVLANGEIFEHLRELKREGKIRAFGASVESMDEALVCMKQEGLASLQIIFNIFRQKPIDALFDEAKRKNVQGDPLSARGSPELQPGREGVQRGRNLRRTAL
jgi:aryl-alcohol dehydrogenase-like predicted oxidoreductase